MGLKQRRRRIYCMENEPCEAGLRPQEQFDSKKLSGVRTAISPLKLDTRTAALSLLAGTLLNKLWLRLTDRATKRLSAIYHLARIQAYLQVLTQRNFNIWSRKNSKQTSSELHHSQEQPTNHERHSQSDITQWRHPRDSLKPGNETKWEKTTDQRSSQLKASNEQLAL